MDAEAQVAGQKEKKTRRRLRLSCVECTKRRQKCDRKYPCSLCTTRNVTHLCRWEDKPFPRPPPGRPPTQANSDSETVIKELSEQVSVLRKALAERDADYFSEPDSDHKPSPAISSDNSPLLFEEGSSYFPFDASSTALPVQPMLRDAYKPAHSLIHLAFGHLGEYLGRGSSLSCLRLISIGEGEIPSFRSSRSTDAFMGSDWPERLASPIEQILSNIPPPETMNHLLGIFFSRRNWIFGIPEEWFYPVSQMMNTRHCGLPEMPINPNWLSLLFAVLACASTGTESKVLISSDHYFSVSLTALHIAENMYQNRPIIGSDSVYSAADGSVLGCLAVPLLCCHYAQKGRLSEAWKILGRWIRIAEAVGLHIDSEGHGWKDMSQEEKCLRRIAWWNLTAWDKIYSLALGRPNMTGQTVGVKFPEVNHGDVSSVARMALYRLSDIAGAVNTKCLGSELSSFQLIEDLDDCLEQWKAELPPNLYIHGSGIGGRMPPSSESSQIHSLFHQAYTLSTWYWYIRMKMHLVHLAYGPSAGDSRSDSQRPRRNNRTTSRIRNRIHCILSCAELIQLQCDVYENFIQPLTACHWTMNGNVNQTPQWGFQGVYTLFEASIALICIRDWQLLGEETITASYAGNLLDRASSVFDCMVNEQSPQLQGSEDELPRVASFLLGLLLRKVEHRTLDFQHSGSGHQAQVYANSPLSSGSYTISSPITPQSLSSTFETTSQVTILNPDVSHGDAFNLTGHSTLWSHDITPSHGLHDWSVDNTITG